jgi:hypothetical protein
MLGVELGFVVWADQAFMGSRTLSESYLPHAVSHIG